MREGGEGSEGIKRRDGHIVGGGEVSIEGGSKLLHTMHQNVSK